MSNTHNKDEGTIVKFNIKDNKGNIVDVTNLTEKLVRFKKPSYTILEKVLTLDVNNTEGVLQCIIGPLEFTEVGDWEVQLRLKMPSGKWSTDKKTFLVDSTLFTD